MTFKGAYGAELEPLDIQTWLEAIRKAQSLLPHEPDEIALSRALRRAFHLSQLTPDPIRAVFAAGCAEERYESLLDAGDLEGAAHALLTPTLEIEVSKPDGWYIVHIRVAGLEGAGTGTSGHPAAAMLEAWFNCISAAFKCATHAQGALNQDRRISPPGPHPSLSLH